MNNFSNLRQSLIRRILNTHMFLFNPNIQVEAEKTNFHKIFCKFANMEKNVNTIPHFSTQFGTHWQNIELIIKFHANNKPF